MSRFLAIWEPDTTHSIDSLRAAGQRMSLVQWPPVCTRAGHASLCWFGDPATTGGDPAGNISTRGPLTLIMDGMVYNRQALNSDPTLCDAALVLALIERAGLDATLEAVNGDFAFALYNADDDSLTLARDRMGLRPLYYAVHEGRFLCASRPLPLLILGVPPAVNTTFAGLFAGSHYRVIDNNTNASPYKHIQQVPAGGVVRFVQGACSLRTWWSPQDVDDLRLSENELVEQYRSLFLDAVNLRLARCRKPLFTLSGGMDSSAILAAARHLTGNKQQAISTVYDDATFDESSAIHHMLDANVEQWHTVRVGEPDVFALIQTMLQMHDEPIATATWLPHWILSQQAAELGVDALTSGLGGDELFGGEYEHFFFYFADLLAQGREAALTHEIACWAKLHDHPLYPKNRTVAEIIMARRTAPNGRCLPDTTCLTRYADAVNTDFFSVRDFVPVMDHPFASALKNRCWQDMHRETSPCCIRAQDRHGMAAGIPVLMPFFDPRLVDFMFQVPGDYKIRNGSNKYLARKAMRGILPNSTCDNVVKTGWNAPAHVWFSGKSREPLMDLIRSTAFRQRGIYNADEVERLANEHERIITQKQVKENHMMFLWQVVNMELWFQWIEKECKAF